MARMITAMPARKVVGGSLAAAIATIVVWVVNSFVLKDNPLPPHVAGAILTVVTFVVGYYVPPASQDQIVQDVPDRTEKVGGLEYRP